MLCNTQIIADNLQLNISKIPFVREVRSTMRSADSLSLVPLTSGPFHEVSVRLERRTSLERQRGDEQTATWQRRETEGWGALAHRT